MRGRCYGTARRLRTTLDFGVAKLALPSRDTDETETLIGTPLYMAPEQFLGGEGTDVRTDVYQVGAVLYHMIEGRPPSHRTVDSGSAALESALRSCSPACSPCCSVASRKAC